MRNIDSGKLAAAARSVTGVGSIGFRVGADGPRLTYRLNDTAIEQTEGVDDADTVVALDRQAWEDLVAQIRTFINLFLAGVLTFERGGFEQLARWDPALKFLHAGIPVYEPDRADLCGRDPSARISLDASDDELREQLQTLGFLHVSGVFTAEEMAAANTEVDRLASLARPGDDESWWATDDSGRDVVCRLVYTTLRSDVLARFETDERVLRLGRLLDRSLRVAPDRMEGTPVLLKAPRKTSGLSNIPWHQDCGMGGHRIICPAVAVGVQLTGSSAETGNLLVVPGSHGQTLPYRWDEQRDDVPVVAVDTQPGDVTVHIQDVMHASPQPTGAGGRRTLYVSFYPATLWDHIGEGESFNDLVRNRTQEVAALQ